MDCCNMLPIAAAHTSQNSCNCLSIFPFIPVWHYCVARGITFAKQTLGEDAKLTFQEAVAQTLPQKVTGNSTNLVNKQSKFACP